LLNSSQTSDLKKLLIAHHEAGHAVMALILGQRIQNISLKEMNSPNGTNKYLGHTTLEPFEQKETLTINEAIRRVMISLAGYASEVLYSGWDSLKIGCDDLTFAVKRVEDMMQSEEFRKSAARLPKPEAGALDMIEHPTVRAFIDYKLRNCVETLAPFELVVQSIAENLYKREEISGEEVAALFDSFEQSSRAPRAR
jgi:ATP-dependent Zn protease